MNRISDDARPKATSAGCPAFLGKLSYSIYLTQATIFFCTVSIFMVMEKTLGLVLTVNADDAPRYLDTGNLHLNNLVGAAVIGLVVLISAFTYKYIEAKGPGAD